MLPTIDLDDELDRQTRKISDIRPNRNLFPKRKPINLIPPNLRPEKFLRLGHIAPKFLRAFHRAASIAPLTRLFKQVSRHA
jgi:hypothetical protein